MKNQRPHRRLMVWIAYADFFATLSIISIVMYASSHSAVAHITPAVPRPHIPPQEARNDHGARVGSGLSPEDYIEIAKGLKALAPDLDKALRSRRLRSALNASQGSVSLPDFAKFDSASANIRDMRAVESLASSIKEIAARDPERAQHYMVLVRGHADAYPVDPNGLFRDNIALSEARARAIVDRLHNSGLGSSGFHVLAEGVGEYEPIVDNCEKDYLQRPRWNCTPLLPPEELEQNRRIELRFAIFPGAFR